ncbi:MAG: thymidine kinase [Bacteroidota bacterium]
MAQLYFYHSAMNAGKSTMLLQANHNYQERGMRTLLFLPQMGDRSEKSMITSRIGLQAAAYPFDARFNFLRYVEKEKDTSTLPIQCILVDEAQFLTKEQVIQLTRIVDDLHIPILAYGLRTDFRGELFEGSHYLLAWADSLKEVKSVCHCGKKATRTVRTDEQGNIREKGPQIQIGGNDIYMATCRKHFYSKKVVPFSRTEQ